jgi:Fic family protein
VKVPPKPPDLGPLLGRTLSDPDRAPRLVAAIVGNPPDRYYHWADLLHLRPPEGLSREEWWCGLKMMRMTQAKPVPLLDKAGQPFMYSVPDLAQRHLHTIDQSLSGLITLSEEVTSPSTRDRYIVSSLIEEAITSSQLEGASTTRQVAKEMLRSGRPPRDKSERMIMNNYLAMQAVRELRDAPLTPERVLDLHRMVTRGTLSSPDAEGRLQTAEDERVEVWIRDQIVHFPPKADELPQRLELMCDFANGSTGPGFMHPVVKAIILHFWAAYDHPFEDGNGRTARALFYWSMLSSKYWLAEYLTISTILRRAPAQYSRSFLYTESDGNDLTYFILYHLKVIVRAIGGLHDYLRRKMEEVRELADIIKASAGFNHRQLALLTHAMHHPGQIYTMASHGRSHGIVYQTARTDLLTLEQAGLLTRLRVGRAYGFTPVPDLADRLRKGPISSTQPRPPTILAVPGAIR